MRAGKAQAHRRRDGFSRVIFIVGHLGARFFVYVRAARDHDIGSATRVVTTKQYVTYIRSASARTLSKYSVCGKCLNASLNDFRTAVRGAEQFSPMLTDAP